MLIHHVALKTILANLKTQIDKLYIDKLVPVPGDLSKLSEAVKMMLLKRMYLINLLLSKQYQY